MNYPRNHFSLPRLFNSSTGAAKLFNFSTFQLFNRSHRACALVAALCAATTAHGAMGTGTITQSTRELVGGMV